MVQIIEESEEYLKAVSPQDQEAGHFPLKQVGGRVFRWDGCCACVHFGMGDGPVLWSCEAASCAE